jgi:hypothetical protein
MKYKKSPKNIIVPVRIARGQRWRWTDLDEADEIIEIINVNRNTSDVSGIYVQITKKAKSDASDVKIGKKISYMTIDPNLNYSPQVVPGDRTGAQGIWTYLQGQDKPKK